MISFMYFNYFIQEMVFMVEAGTQLVVWIKLLPHLSQWKDFLSLTNMVLEINQTTLFTGA